ncbi:MAG TPA: transcription elongation factor GreA [Actinomycetota bacterium]|nr:transcription elongation factor GreA [Actinomycetota bacterium]
MTESDRPILSQPAIEALRAELESLKEDGRRQMSERLLAARELGDVSDSAEFESAKQDQALMEGRIAKLEDLIKRAVVMEAPEDISSVGRGVLVTVRDVDSPQFEDSYVIAESEERVTGARVLSPQSPLGQALIGKKIGDRVTYNAPGGTFTYEVVSLAAADVT